MKFSIKYLLIIIFNLSIVYGQNKEYLKQFTGFPLGASVDGEVLMKNKVYRDLVANEFNSLTTENHLKMYRVHPRQNSYDFAMGDSIVAFALRNNMRVHGHTLVWFDGMADWAKNFRGTKQDWENLIKNHIQTVVGHYKGKITSWDVVNEYLTQDHDSVRKFIVQEKLGDDYMAKCFRWAHEADPNALLIYNEYGMEWSESKLLGVIRIANDFQKRGIPLDGLGVQFHLKIFNSNERIEHVLKELSKTGLKIHVSELDMMVNTTNSATLVYTDSLKKVQMEKYLFVFDAYRKYVPDSQKYGITFWNVGDKDTWLRPTYKIMEYPLLFDENYERKLVYDALIQRMKNN